MMFSYPRSDRSCCTGGKGSSDRDTKQLWRAGRSRESGLEEGGGGMPALEPEETAALDDGANTKMLATTTGADL